MWNITSVNWWMVTFWFDASYDPSCLWHCFLNPSSTCNSKLSVQRQFQRTMDKSQIRWNDSRFILLTGRYFTHYLLTWYHVSVTAGYASAMNNKPRELSILVSSTVVLLKLSWLTSTSEFNPVSSHPQAGIQVHQSVHRMISPHIPTLWERCLDILTPVLTGSFVCSSP